MSVEASPPQQPPMLSPDGNWVWDGTQWQPIAVKHEGVFPSYAAIRVDPAAATERGPVQVARPSVVGPPPEYTMDSTDSAPYPIAAAAEPRRATPLWQAPATGLNKYLYYVAGAMVFVIALAVINAFVPFSTLWAASEPDSQPTPSPTPLLATRTDYDRADRFVNVLLGPAMAKVTDTAQAQKETCNGAMTVSCRSALTETENQVVNTLGVIDKAEIPTCIAPYAAKLKADLVAMDTQVKLAIKGYTDNKKAELTLGLYRFGVSARPLAADNAAIGKALQTQCDTQLAGP